MLIIIEQKKRLLRTAVFLGACPRPASQKVVRADFGDADPGGLGACPRYTVAQFSYFFSEKEAKALVLLYSGV